MTHILLVVSRSHVIPSTAEGIALLQEASLNPVLVYLSQLRAGSRRTMQGALKAITLMFSDGKFDALSFP